MARVTVRRVLIYEGEADAVERTLRDGMIPANGSYTVRGKPKNRTLVITSSVGPADGIEVQRKEKT